MLMSRLLSEPEARTNENTTKAIKAIQESVVKERNKRKEQIREVRKEFKAEIKELRDELHQPRAASTVHNMSEGTSEVVIGGFRRKSKTGAMAMVTTILSSINSKTVILEEKRAAVPDVVPVQFESHDEALEFVRYYKLRTDFPGYFRGFWCNMNQTLEERDHF